MGSGIFRQRSRWCKGFFQLLFRWDSPFSHPSLPFVSKIVVLLRTVLYLSAALAMPILTVQILVSVFKTPGIPFNPPAGVSKDGEVGKRAGVNFTAAVLLAYNVSGWAGENPLQALKTVKLCATILNVLKN